MHRRPIRKGAVTLLGACVALSPTFALTKPLTTRQEITSPDVEVDRVGSTEVELPSKAIADTVWIAMWSFDNGHGGCTAAGWQRIDNRILNDGSNFWHIEPSAFDGVRFVIGGAAALGTHDDSCCKYANGYDNDWYYGIRVPYEGPATLSFDYLIESEKGFDFIEVETDSGCVSFSRVDYRVYPDRNARDYRTRAFSDSGNNNTAGNARVTGLALRNPGPGTHCAYISFHSDRAASPCDGGTPTTLGEAVVVDNISISDAGGTRTEDFEDGNLSNGWVFVNMQDSKPFGEWGRLYFHISDNDACTENTTCAWLWTDYTTPTLFTDYSAGFGPGGFCVRHWLDNIIVSPWVSLASTPTAVATVLRFRRFPGAFFISRQVANWSVRGKIVRSGQECTRWDHTSQWNSLGQFHWITYTFDMTPFFDPGSSQVQIRHRVSDYQWIAGNFCLLCTPYPGPYLDDVRIGRILRSGPVLSEGSDARSQAQDCFATEIDPVITPAGEHFRPTTDRFGVCAFSSGTDLGINRMSPNLITGDSIWIQVTDARRTGGIAAVEWHGAIASGPHVGKAPPPYSSAASGFFTVIADSVRDANGVVVQGKFFVDLDDTYFRGGDTLLYFWLATDAGGGTSSDPEGLDGVRASIAAAERATGGLLEVSFLPGIDWAPSYLARVAADPNGDLEPTAVELAGSTQRNCILYVNHHNARRRSGDLNRSSFMYTLDVLGYRDHYDVYDHSGMGNTNNHLGGRASMQQAQGYNLIVYDAGNSAPGRPIMPDGGYPDMEKVDQAGWFRSWLAQAPTSAARFATLWVIGSNVVEEHPTNMLYSSNCGVTLASTNQGLNVNPDVVGQASFTFDKGSESYTVSFATGERAAFGLNGGCPEIRYYDALNASAGTSARIYRYRSPYFDPLGVRLGGGAVIMNSNAGEDWNTIVMSFPWFDIREMSGGAPANPQPAQDLLSSILHAVLPAACQRTPVPTDVAEQPNRTARPLRTALYGNTPNPFNPATTIRFDLAAAGQVRLVIYDVAGRRVRTLVDAPMTAGAGKRVVWDGLDDAGRHAATGLYWCRFEAPDFVATRKMLLVQ